MSLLHLRGSNRAGVGTQVSSLSTALIHKGRGRVVRYAEWKEGRKEETRESWTHVLYLRVGRFLGRSRSDGHWLRRLCREDPLSMPSPLRLGDVLQTFVCPLGAGLHAGPGCRLDDGAVAALRQPGESCGLCAAMRGE